ncbi:MAG: ferritin [Abditibacteriaceae bacterium]
MPKARFSKKMGEELNKQMTREANAAQFYLSFGSWAEVQGFDGIAAFLYNHVDEERKHMQKFLAFINQRGGHCKVTALPAPPADPKNLEDLFNKVLSQEEGNSAYINNLVELAFEEKDYPTNSFLQWFVKEQIEEEALASKLVDSMKVIGEDSGNRGGLYEFDKNIEAMHDAQIARDEA